MIMFSLQTRSSVSYATGLFVAEDVESNEPNTFRLGVYEFPENKFRWKLHRIHRGEPYSSRLALAKGSTIAWSNERLGYTVSVALSGPLTPLRPMEDRENVAYNVFVFVYRAFVRFGSDRLKCYDRLLDTTEWFRAF